MLVWLVLVILSINLGIAVIWFTYAVLIERRFRDSLFPQSGWRRPALARLFKHAKERPELRQAMLDLKWERLERYGLTMLEKQFLLESSREQLSLWIAMASKTIARR